MKNIPSRTSNLIKGKLNEIYAPDFTPTTEEVLNGIAWDKESETLYVTGKNWPVIFKINFRKER